MIANGIVNVSAKDLGTGKEQHITITAGSNMSDDEIDKAVKEAAEYEDRIRSRKSHDNKERSRFLRLPRQRRLWVK